MMDNKKPRKKQITLSGDTQINPKSKKELISLKYISLLLKNSSD
jgi:hypothetical protein